MVSYQLLGPEFLGLLLLLPVPLVQLRGAYLHVVAHQRVQESVRQAMPCAMLWQA